MRITVTGAQNVGKSTLVNAIKAYWPMFSQPEKSYKDAVREKNLPINESGTLESQTIIRDYLVDIALANAGKKHTVHDRCILDNLVYTLWLDEHGKLGEKSTDFITSTIHLHRECMKFYDIVFWLPINENIILEEKEQRSTSKEYQKEIDNIFYGIYEEYKKNTNVFFDKENQPAFIVLEGDVDQKIEQIRQYIDADGNLIETTHSVLGDLEHEYDKMCLSKQVGIQK